MHDEAEVGLVVAHAERARGHDRLELVAQQPLLDVDAPLGLDLAAVGLGRDAVGVEEVGDQVGVALGERVDDAGARQLRQVGGEPREPVGGRRQLDDLQAQRRAAQRPAVGAQRAGVAELQLLDDVGHDAVVGGRGRARAPRRPPGARSSISAMRR